MIAYPVIFTRLAECVVAEVPDLNMIVKDKSFRHVHKLVQRSIENKLRTTNEEARIQPSKIEFVSDNNSYFADEGCSLIQMVSVNV